MTDELEIIADENGVALIGDAAEIDRFLGSSGLSSAELDLSRITWSSVSSGTSVALKGAEGLAASGRWVKLTAESAKIFKTADLMAGPTKGVGRAVLMKQGKTSHILQIVTTKGSLLTNPALLGGAAGIMAQLAMQQAMKEITDYLAVIDKKVDAIIRSQKDAAIAEMIGVGFVVDEAFALRDQVSRVSEITWSKVQNTTFTIAKTQAYALRQLDGIASKLEREKDVSDLVELLNTSKVDVEEWLAVLARCFQLQDAVAILELDRVFDSTPEEFDNHREALRTSRLNRQSLISKSTKQLVERMDAVATFGNSKVLLHPLAAKSLVGSSNHVAGDLVRFQAALGIDHSREDQDARKWKDAATELKDKVVDTGVSGVDVVTRVGGESLEHAKNATGKLVNNLSGFKNRVTKKKSDPEES